MVDIRACGLRKPLAKRQSVLAGVAAARRDANRQELRDQYAGGFGAADGDI